MRLSNRSQNNGDGEEQGVFRHEVLEKASLRLRCKHSDLAEQMRMFVRLATVTDFSQEAPVLTAVLIRLAVSLCRCPRVTPTVSFSL